MDVHSLQLALLVLSALTMVIVAGGCVDFVLGYRRLRSLKDVTPTDVVPSLSIVAAARNEARGIEAAVTSLLALDYPDLEVVVVDDRSTDETGSILDLLSREHTLASGAERRCKLTIKHLSELPEGWLGKNHALHVGAA